MQQTSNFQFREDGMRKKVSGFVDACAISGTHVVFLAFGMKGADAKGVMGFAIQRSDLT